MKIARTTSGKYVVDAVSKALDILEAFQDPEGLTLNAVSRQVGLNKSRTFRLLHTLAERGYVERSADGSCYRLGTKIVERATHVRRDIRDVARPLMIGLRERFNEMVNLSVLDGEHVLYLHILESTRPFRMSATVGCRMTSHKTSMGKAMLAFHLADDARSPYFFHLAKLPRSSRQRMRKELERVRQIGYAMDNEENEPGVACIGAPIFDETQPIGAMSVSGPVHRILQNKTKIAEALMAACKQVSRNLGHASETDSLPQRQSMSAKA